METKNTLKPTDDEILAGYLRATSGVIAEDKVRVFAGYTEDIKERVSDIFYRDLYLLATDRLDTVLVNTINQAYNFAEFTITERAPILLRRVAAYGGPGVGVSITSASVILTKKPTDAEVSEAFARFEAYKRKNKKLKKTDTQLVQIRFCELTKLPGKWFIQFAFLVLP